MIRKQLLFAVVLMTSNLSFSQYNTDWYFPGISNSTPSGYIGIGTSTSSNGITPLPGYNLQVHGIVDYIPSNTYSSFTTSGDTSGTLSVVSAQKTSINYGKTSRIGLTNSLTGKSDMEGAVLQMSEYNFTIKNQENGDLTFEVPGLNFRMSNSTSRAWLGGTTPTSSSIYAKMNIASPDNGLYIQTHNTLRYGMSIKMAGDNANAIQVFGQGVTGVKNFKVTGGGEVFARKYTTTLSNIPDYVFASDYNLMPLSELRSYIQTNNHLPNIPSATEMESQPVDLGEMNRLLLEKVEELTLYVLELESRMNDIEK